MGVSKSNLLKNVYFQSFIVFILAGAYFSLFQFSTDNLVGYDSHYHIKIAYLYRTEGLVQDMPWMYYTLYNQGFADVYLLYHLFQAPFTFFDLKVGAKLAQILFSCLAVSMVFFFLRYNKMKFSFIWVLIMISLNGRFLARMTMQRGAALSIFLFVLGVYLLFRKRYIALFFLSMIYTYAYPAFYFFLGFCVIYFLSVYFKDRILNWEILIYSFLGSAFALVVNPFFPRNIYLVFYHTILTSFGPQISIISEWAPLHFSKIVANPVVYLLFFISIGLVVYNFRKQNSKIIALFFLSIISYLMMMFHSRFVEYWVPFTILFVPFILEEKIFLLLKKKKNIVFFIILVVLIGLVVFNVYKTVEQNFVYGEISEYKNNYENCTSWMKKNTPEGSHLFITSNHWSDFPALFFYSTHNYYTLGLDEFNMYYYNKTLFFKYVNIMKQSTSDHRKVLLEDFDSEYVFIDKPGMISNMSQINRSVPFYLNESMFDLAYRDRWCGIYKVKRDEG